MSDMSDRLLWIGAAIVIVVGMMSVTYVVSKCGAKGLLYGNGAVFVAASGECDN